MGLMMTNRYFANFSEVRVGQKFQVAGGAGVVYTKVTAASARAAHNDGIYRLHPGRLCEVIPNNPNRDLDGNENIYGD